VFEGKRAVGVSYIQGGRGGTAKEIGATREVVLCAGALNTPKLLQLSGIGPQALLRDHGLDVLVDLAGVGNNLKDHYGVRMVARLKGVRTLNSMAQGLPLGLEIAKWLLGRPSVLSISPSLAHLFWKSLPELDIPDLEFVFTPASFREGVVGLLDRSPGMTLGAWQTRPESKGYVKIVSRDIFEPPEINPNYLAETHDQRVLLRSIRLGRKLLSTAPLQPYLEGYSNPADTLQTDDELLDWGRRNGITVYHMIGTARMGPDNDRQAVVDAELRVKGVEGLRIGDASIMPVMPSGNTNAPTMMIAEKASDMILGKKMDPIEDSCAKSTRV
jgi:choline dehydrogenase